MQEFCQALTQLPPQRSSPWWAICPPVAWVQWITPIRHMGGHMRGLVEGACAGFTTIVINLNVLLLVVLTNRSPTVKHGGRNGIHRWQRVPKQYDYIISLLMWATMKLAMTKMKANHWWFQMAMLSKLTSIEKGQKLTYSSYIERFKVNFNVKRFKVTHTALWSGSKLPMLPYERFKVIHIAVLIQICVSLFPSCHQN